MMTGQILSGVSPLVAVRYQIVVMCMIFSSAGIASAMFLVLSKPSFINKAMGGESF
jgi:putative ABC transport system permease protein